MLSVVLAIINLLLLTLSMKATDAARLKNVLAKKEFDYVLMKA